MYPYLQTYHQSAKKLKLSSQFLTQDCLEIRIGKNIFYFMDNITPFNHGASVYLHKLKNFTDYFLKDLAYPIPASILVTRDAFLKGDYTEDLFEELGPSLVVKSAWNNTSKQSIVCNLNAKELIQSLGALFEKRPLWRVETFYPQSKIYSILVFNHKVLNVIEHIPLTITGNGIENIQQIIARENTIKKARNLKIIPLDEDCVNCLNKQGYQLSSILAKNKSIEISYAADRWRGSPIRSHANTIHPENAQLLIALANKLNLNLVSIKFICEHIERPFSKSLWKIINVNNLPDLSVHETPDSGDPVNVSEILLKYLIKKHWFAFKKEQIKRLFAKT